MRLETGILIGAFLCFATGVASQELPKRLFTVKEPGGIDLGKPAGGPKKLSEAEIKAAVQKWWNDPSSPLVIAKIGKQDAPDKFSVRLGEADWEPLDGAIGPPAPSPQVIAVPVSYRFGKVTVESLFVIDRGTVINGFRNYKKIP